MTEVPGAEWSWCRHGETEWSRTGRHTGRTDVPLDDVGRKQAAALAAAPTARSFALVLTSPLSRATETCALAGFGGAGAGRRGPARVGLRGLRGPDHRRDPAEPPGLDPVGPTGCRAGRAPPTVGRRADRVIEPARSARATPCCFAHGHLLRVLAARWVGLPAAGGACSPSAPARERAGLGAGGRRYRPLERATARERQHRPAARRGGATRRRVTMSARVKEARWLRMVSPTSAQTANSTHWPSWSQAPPVWGSPKSPATMGPSTAETIWARVISSGAAGQHVAAAHAPLGAHEPGALQRQEDLLEVRLGKPGAIGDVPDRGGRGLRRRGGPATAAPGSRSRRGSRPSRADATPHPPDPTRSAPRGTPRLWCGARHPDATVTPTPVLPDFDGPCLTNVVPALLGRADGDAGPVGDWVPGPVAERAPGGPPAPRRPGLGAAAKTAPRWPRRSRAGIGGRSPRWPRAPRPCALTSLTTGLPPAVHGVLGYRVACRRRGT